MPSFRLKVGRASASIQTIAEDWLSFLPEVFEEAETAMDPEPGYLHILCGKIAAGKSTLARELSEGPATVLLSEDDWLADLFGPEMASIKDYVRFSARLRTVIEPHICSLLAAGVSVVLDFPANTPEMRGWMKRIIETTDCPHTLHYLNVSDETCRIRLKERNASGSHPFSVSDEQFDAITRHFVPPGTEEGFVIREHRDIHPLNA